MEAQILWRTPPAEEGAGPPLRTVQGGKGLFEVGGTHIAEVLAQMNHAILQLCIGTQHVDFVR